MQLANLILLHGFNMIKHWKIVNRLKKHKLVEKNCRSDDAYHVDLNPSSDQKSSLARLHAGLTISMSDEKHKNKTNVNAKKGHKYL